MNFSEIPENPFIFLCWVTALGLFLSLTEATLKIKLDKNVEFLHIYGFVFFNLKKYDQSINVWKKAITIDPEFTQGLNNLVSSLRKYKNLLGNNEKTFSQEEKNVANKLRYWESPEL